MKFILRWIITAIAVGVAVWLVPGIDVTDSNAYIPIGVLAIILALLNVSIKPFLQLISLPISILTLGIFALVVNTAVLGLAAWLANSIFNIGFVIDGFWAAFFASIVISIVTMVLNALVGVNDKD